MIGESNGALTIDDSWVKQMKEQCKVNNFSAIWNIDDYDSY